MEFPFNSLSEALINSDYIRSNKHFPLYAFILATESDSEIFPNLLRHYKELNDLTLGQILIIAPSVKDVWMKGQRKLSPSKIMRILRDGVYYDKYAHEDLNISNNVRDFLERQTSEAYRFAEIIGVTKDNFPCIALFDSLENQPGEHIIWRLKGQSAEDVVGDFRRIVATVERKPKKLLKDISNLQKDRFSFRELNLQSWLPTGLSLAGLALQYWQDIH
jgi:hypothetical protein